MSFDWRKNIFNSSDCCTSCDDSYSGLTGPTGATGSSFSPGDVDARTNILTKSGYPNIDITNNTSGIGLPLPLLNGLTATGVSGLFHYWPGQNDSAYYNCFFDPDYQNGAIQINILQSGWYLMEGTIVVGSPGTVNTQNISFAWRKYLSGTPVVPLFAGQAMITEPTAGGGAFCTSFFAYHNAGDTLMPVIMCTNTTPFCDMTSGALGCSTYLKIVRF